MERRITASTSPRVFLWCAWVDSRKGQGALRPALVQQPASGRRYSWLLPALPAYRAPVHPVPRHSRRLRVYLAAWVPLAQSSNRSPHVQRGMRPGAQQTLVPLRVRQPTATRPGGIASSLITAMGYYSAIMGDRLAVLPWVMSINWSACWTPATTVSFQQRTLRPKEKRGIKASRGVPLPEETPARGTLHVRFGGLAACFFYEVLSVSAPYHNGFMVAPTSEPGSGRGRGSSLRGRLLAGTRSPRRATTCTLT